MVRRLTIRDRPVDDPGGGGLRYPPTVVYDTKRSQVDVAIDALVGERREFSAPEVAARAGVSRQAAQRRLARYVSAGRLEAAGAARARRYFAPGTATTPEEWRFTNKGLAEDVIWRELRASSRHVRSLAGNALAIAGYAFTEIFNNAIDHSGSPRIQVEIEPSNGRVAIEIRDEGVGIFQQIKTAYTLNSYMDALAELSKGKVTTQPERHSGQGIFFVSKAVDLFEIDSGGLRWTIDNVRRDTAVGQAPLMRGTRVRFEITRDKSETLQDLFGEYSTELEFDKTRTLVRLFERGGEFVSRSEAKRLLAGLEKFREVILDFDRVDQIGQGFADEVFRVWAHDHPDTRLLPVNMNEPVSFLVKRAQAEAAAGPSLPEAR